MLTAEGVPVTPGRQLGKGGRGTVFQATSHPGRVYEQFSPETLAKDATLERRLNAMVSAGPPERYEAATRHQVLAWPDAVVTLIDCDSMQITDPVSGERFFCAVVMPEFQPPERAGTKPAADRPARLRRPVRAGRPPVSATAGATPEAIAPFLAAVDDQTGDDLTLVAALRPRIVRSHRAPNGPARIADE